MISKDKVFGEEWITLNLYCNEYSSDKVINLVINNLIESLKINIDQWFFLRYKEVSYHLRLRIKPKEKYNILIKRIPYLLNPFLKSKLIWRVQFDTYVKEIERYSYSSIEVTQRIFYAQSKLAIEIINLNLSLEEKIKCCQIILFEFLQISFNKNKESILSFLEKFNSYNNIKVFNTKYKKKQLGIRYRNLKKVNLCRYDIDNKILLLKNEIEGLNIHEFQNENLKVKSDFIISHMHMIVNRIMPNNHAIYEALLLNFLTKFVKEEKYKSQNKIKN